MRLPFRNILFAFVGIGCLLYAQKGLAQNKPNVIIILLDDAGYVDFGFMGSEDLKTPEIDKLAAASVVFSDAHVSATVCAPSRAGIMTGIYQQRFGFEANHTGDATSGDLGLGSDVITIADVFQKNNYATIALGKWHLGATEEDIPNNRGFDDFYGFLAGARSYFPLDNPSKMHMLQHNGKRVKFEGYLTDILTDKAISYTTEHKEKPFFMYLSYNAVHTPMHAKKEHLEKFKGHSRKKLAAMTWSLDENIGRLVNQLKANGQLDNTLIFFLSDNGGAGNNSSSNGHLKGFKGNKFEGGHRVPFFIHWPAQLKGIKSYSGLSSSLDIFTTAIAAASITAPESQPLDGTNLLPYLINKKTKEAHNQLYWRKLDEAAARIGDFKLIRLEGYGSRLYNLSEDISEQNDLSASHPEKLKELINALESWESKMMQPLWKEDKAWMQVTYHIHEQLMQNLPILYRSPAQLNNHKLNNPN